MHRSIFSNIETFLQEFLSLSKANAHELLANPEKNVTFVFNVSRTSDYMEMSNYPYSKC